MRMILAGVLSAVALGFVAGFGLYEMQTYAFKAFATAETRVGNPGHNLVGDDWSGLNVEGPGEHRKTEQR